MSQQTTRSNSQTPEATQESPTQIKRTDPDHLQKLWKMPIPVSSLTNSPGCEPRAQRRGSIAPVARVRPVRVDAWSEPASVSWTRTRKAARKVAARRPQPTEWALPF